MNAVETRMEKLGHLRFSFPKGRFIWFALQPGVVDFKYRFVRDMESLNRTTPTTQTPVAIFVDSDQSKTLKGVVKQFPRWRSLSIGGPGLATDQPMTVATQTVSLVLAYGDAEWTGLLQEQVNAVEDGPDFMSRVMSVPDIESRSLQREPESNGRYRGDVERLRHWWRTPNNGLQVRDMIDMRPVTTF